MFGRKRCPSSHPTMVSIEHDHDKLQHVEDDARFNVIGSLRPAAIKLQITRLRSTMCCTVRLECSGRLALASPPFERCPEGSELNALSLEQEASLANHLKFQLALGDCQRTPRKQSCSDSSRDSNPCTLPSMPRDLTTKLRFLLQPGAGTPFHQIRPFPPN